MDSERTAASVGVLACLLTAGAVVAPYLLLPPDLVGTIQDYYANGAVTPYAPGLLGLIGAIVFASGRQGRSDPDLVAGITLAVGVFSFVVALEWALAFRPDLVGSREALEFMATHRWSVPAAALLEALAALWFAASRRLIPVPAAGSR